MIEGIISLLVSTQTPEKFSTFLYLPKKCSQKTKECQGRLTFHDVSLGKRLWKIYVHLSIPNPGRAVFWTWMLKASRNEIMFLRHTSYGFCLILGDVNWSFLRTEVIMTDKQKEPESQSMLTALTIPRSSNNYFELLVTLNCLFEPWIIKVVRAVNH